MKKNVRKLPNYIKKEIINTYSKDSFEYVTDYMYKYNVPITMKNEFFTILDTLSKRNISIDIYNNERFNSHYIDEDIINKVWQDLAAKYLPTDKELFKLKKRNDPALKEYLKAYKRIQNYESKNKNSEKAKRISKMAFKHIRNYYNEYLANNLCLDDLVFLLSEYKYKELEKL